MEWHDTLVTESNDIYTHIWIPADSDVLLDEEHAAADMGSQNAISIPQPLSAVGIMQIPTWHQVLL